MAEARQLVAVNVEFMGPFELDFEKTGVVIRLPAPVTIASLVEALAARWPGGAHLRRLLLGASERSRYCIVSLDHVMLDPTGVLAVPVHDGARVCFAMPMVGG